MINKEALERILCEEYSRQKRTYEEEIKSRKFMGANKAFGGMASIERVTENIEEETDNTLFIGRESETLMVKDRSRRNNLPISSETTRQQPE